MSENDAKKPLFNEYEAYNEDAYALSNEVVKALEPILDRYSQNHTLRDIESVVLGSAAVITSEKILRAAIHRHNMEKAEERYAGVNHVRRAFDLVHSFPDVERGFLQHTLLVALNEPGVADQHLLPEALLILPKLLRGTDFTFEYDIGDQTGDAILELAEKLVELAKRDRRFLDNFLAGKSAASMF